MDKRYAIFDMDGTLIDSMGYWGRLAVEYLESKGVHQVNPRVLEQITPLPLIQSAALFIEEYGLKGTPETIAGEITAMMEGHYHHDISLKPGVQAYLERLHANGVRMCVASATAERLIDACLRRLGVRDYFEVLASCVTVGVGKTRPDVYDVCTRHFGVERSQVAVYEDAIHGAKTAKEAGYHVVGVYDESSLPRLDELKQLVDEWIQDWETA